VSHGTLLRLRVAASVAVLAIVLSSSARGQTYEVIHVFT
jgi:hypothetical protein